MSYLSNAKLKDISTEYKTTRQCVEYISKRLILLANDELLTGLELKEVRRAAEQLGETYLIKLFAEFEGVLRADLAASRPGKRTTRTPMEMVINSVASRRSVPNERRDRVHVVREYRNWLVHRNGSAPESVDFDTALSHLNRYVARLPYPS